MWSTDAAKDREDFWNDAAIVFPAAWPSRSPLPISVRDLEKLPAKYDLLCLDELVASFWFVVDQLLERQAKLAEKLKTQPGDATLVAAKRAVDDLLEAGLRLQRNVPFVLQFFASEDERETEALSQREDLVVLREYCSLVGWNRIVVIGSKRDSLKQNGALKNEAKATADALSNVRWGPGRQITEEVAEKVLTVWDKYKDQPRVILLIQASQRKHGTKSALEDYTKLLHFARSKQTIEETLWLLGQISVQQDQKGESMTRLEMERRSGSLSIYQLRKKTVDGLLEELITGPGGAISVYSALASSLPETAPMVAALKKFNANHADPLTYWAHRKAMDAEAPTDGLPLPQWVSLRLTKLLRQVFDGLKDKSYHGVCNHPPRGGFQSITWKEHLSSGDLFSEPCAALRKELGAWATELRKKAAGDADDKADGSAGGQPAGQEKRTEATKADEPEDELRLIREEIKNAGQEYRRAYVSFTEIPSSAVGIKMVIQSSATYKNAAGKNLSFGYAVCASWDRPKQPGRDRRLQKGNEPLLLEGEFETFVEVCDLMITAENKCYAAILCGAYRRPGKSLKLQSGLIREEYILNTFEKNVKNGLWRVKRTHLHFDAPDDPSARGGARNLGDALFYIYRGRWPAGLPSSVRTLLGGRTSDDVWTAVPQAGAALLQVPYYIKVQIFDDVWMSLSAEDRSGPKPETDDENEKDEKDEEQPPRKKARKSIKKATGAAPEQAPKKKKTKPAPKKKLRQTALAFKTKLRKKRRAGAKVNIDDVALPAYTGDEAGRANAMAREDLFHHDYHETVYRQMLWQEWKSRGAIVFTVGSGTCGVAAIKEEKPMLGLTLNTEHSLLATYAVDSWAGNAVQVSTSSLYDEQLHKKVQRVLAGRAGDDVDGDTPEKPKTKVKKPKKKKAGAEGAAPKKKVPTGAAATTKKAPKNQSNEAEPDEGEDDEGEESEPVSDSEVSEDVDE